MDLVCRNFELRDVSSTEAMNHMVRLLTNLVGLFSQKGRNDPRIEGIDDAIQGVLRKVRSADPETPQQWARLQGVLTQQAAAPTPARAHRIPRFAFAAAVVATAIVGAILYFAPTQPALEILSTGRGEQQQVVLADGSEVRLHHTTELIVSPMQPGKPRRVSLRGEAFFRVRRNDTPFIITTDQATVEVLGTEFNVHVRRQSLEVAVIDGKVKVQSSGTAVGDALVLTQKQIGVSRLNEAPRFAGTLPSDEYPGWMSGKLFLNKTPFAEACREIELRFDATIAISNNRVGSKEISGILDARSARSAVTALCELTGTQYTQEGNAFKVF